MKRLLFAIGLMLVLQNAWAIDIREAKELGLVGEANSGYIAAVKAPPSSEVKALIAEVNKKRIARFKASAEQRGLTVEQVANRFYELAVEKTQPGHYYQDTGGRWKKK